MVHQVPMYVGILNLKFNLLASVQILAFPIAIQI